MASRNPHASSIELAPIRERSSSSGRVDALLKEIKDCRVCERYLPLGPRPILRISPSARILLVGQAPGIKVHESGVPWKDASGIRLRQWLEVDEPTFYDARRCAIVPMGMCYPGRGTGGDLPPRPECAPLWHDRIFALMPQIRLTILIGQYALAKFLGERRQPTLAQTVAAWESYAPQFIALPHPSPRNLNWLKLNPWFEKDVVPMLRRRVKQALA
jgi:uracil-DNA glycosylase